MEKRIIYLIRHGCIRAVDHQRRYIGHSDIPLDEVGILQAQRLKSRLEHVRIQAVFCSDLSRSMQTAAEIVAQKHVSIIPRKDLREICMGKWEGLTFSEIAQRFPKEFKERGQKIESYRVPGGESFNDCQIRVITALQNIMDTTTEDILIVGHAGVNRLILCSILGMPVANVFRLVQDYGCLNIIAYGQKGYQVQLINACRRI